MQPDAGGHYGPYGGKYVIETLMPALEQLEHEFDKAMANKEFRRLLDRYRSTYIGRPTPLYYAAGLTARCGGARIYLKREDLNHTGATRSTTPSDRRCWRFG